VTGEPVHIGGSEGRAEATDYGVAVCAREAAKPFGISLKGATVAVQGYGNVGFYTARFPHEQEASIVAVSDPKGGIFCKDGLDPVKVMEHKKKSVSVVDYQGARNISNQELLELEVDFLIPAALERQITERNADNVKARLVVEGANGPTTPEADKILDEKGVKVVHVILANAGGVTVSYFEWVQNLQRFQWNRETLSRLDNRMVKSFNDVLRSSEKYGTNMRMGAMLLAVNRVAEAAQLLGIWP